MVKNLQLVSRVEVVHSSECQIDSFFFTIDISGQTVQPVFLCSPFHYQQRSREQWESNKIGGSIFSSKFKHSYSSKRHYCNISKKIQALKSKKCKFIYLKLNFTIKIKFQKSQIPSQKIVASTKHSQNHSQWFEFFKCPLKNY